MDTIQEFTNHLKHVIEEQEGIKLSPKSLYDIKQTLLGANRVATRGSIHNMEEWKHRYFDLKKGNKK